MKRARGLEIGTARITVVTSFARLEPRNSRFWMRTDLRVEGSDQTVHVESSARRRWAGTVSFYTIEDHQAVPVPCERAGLDIDYDRDRVRARRPEALEEWIVAAEPLRFLGRDPPPAGDLGDRRRPRSA